jgi:hypothetical protein
MSEPKRPDWLKNARRVDRPEIDKWYKPDHDGDLEGRLIWQGDQENHFRPGETAHLFVVRDERTGVVFGVQERAALRGLRRAKVGSRVFLSPKGARDLPDGRGKRWEFEVYVEDSADADPGPEVAGDAIPF